MLMVRIIIMCGGQEGFLMLQKMKIRLRAYSTRGEELVPIGVHGTMVAVDWDACYADGSCIEVCPVKLYEWTRTDNDIPTGTRWRISLGSGNGSTDKEGRVDYTDKSDPIREQDCIWCMACVAVCPPQAIKVESI